MAKPKTTRSAPAKRAQTESLGPGLHLARIELEAGETYRVRTSDGLRVAARLDESVERAFADDCLRTHRRVLVVQTPHSPTIVGALQTSRGVDVDSDGRASLRAREVRLIADRSIVLEAGPVGLRLDKSGSIKVEGTRMTIDVASLLKVLAAKVELP